MSFASLPYELQSDIVLRYLDSQARESASTFPAAAFPSKFVQRQALMLSRVSRSCNSITTRLLYRHICVPKPSTLRQLHSTLTRRPDLAALVASIHLGPTYELQERGWPIALGQDRKGRPLDLFIKTSVSWGHEEDLWPLWCRPGDQFRLKEPIEDNCQSYAIAKAMDAAMQDLDVEPWRRDYSKESQKIGRREWATRLYLLQAALDLYLKEMRLADDERDYDIIEERPPKRPMGQQKTARACKISLCGHYPRLKIVHSFDPPAPDVGLAGELLVVSIPDLWELLERPGGTGDHSDNLLFFLDSSRSALNLGQLEWRRVIGLLAGPRGRGLSDAAWRQARQSVDADSPKEQAGFQETDERQHDSPGPAAEGVSELASGHEDWHSARSQQSEATIEDLGCPSFGVEDYITMARSILSLTTHATNVSLSSYLERALPALSQPGLLRSVSLGPLSDWWPNVFSSGFVERMASLVRLRIVGRIWSSDAAALCRELPTLKELRWVWPSGAALPAEAYIIVSTLQGRDGSPFLAGQEQQLLLEESNSNSLEGESSASDSAGSDSTSIEASETDYYTPSEGSLPPPRPAWPHRTTTIFLHADIAPGMLSSATVSQDVRDAWTEGRRVSGTLHPVKVIEIALDRGGDGEVTNSAMERLASLLYAGGRTWWLEGRERIGAVETVR